MNIFDVEKIILMKVKNLFLLIAASIFVSANAQIFINTGNPNLDKYKTEGSTVIDPAATKVETTTPQVKVTTTPTSVKVNTTTPTVTTKTKTTTKSTTAKTTSSTASASASYNSATTSGYDGTINEANNNLPPNAEAGKCYARCYIQDLYEFREEQVIDRPASMRVQSIPATYKTVFDTVITRPASVRYNQVPAVYETITEDIMVSPATQKWEKRTADPNCLSANPEDCQVMCLVEVPAVYKKVSRKVIKTPAYRQEIPVSAEYKIVSRQVIETPARQEQVTIDATYKNVVKKVLSKKGGYSDWREILCASKLTTERITQIQRALKAAGYDPGPIDNVFGAQTKAALVKYQQDKNLPVGNLNMETLKSLGVE